MGIFGGLGSSEQEFGSIPMDLILGLVDEDRQPSGERFAAHKMEAAEAGEADGSAGAGSSEAGDNKAGSNAEVAAAPEVADNEANAPEGHEVQAE